MCKRHITINSKRKMAAPFPISTGVMFLEMKTHHIHTNSGELHAFEIGNTLVGRRKVLKIVKNIPGATVTKKPRFLSWFRESEFCQFIINGKLFTVEEPFGDNSRYIISTEPPGPCAELEFVEKVFSEAR